MAAAGIVFNTIFVLTAFVTVNPEDETLHAKGEFDTLTIDPDQVQCNLDDNGVLQDKSCNKENGQYPYFSSLPYFFFPTVSLLL